MSKILRLTRYEVIQNQSTDLYVNMDEVQYFYPWNDSKKPGQCCTRLKIEGSNETLDVREPPTEIMFLHSLIAD